LLPLAAETALPADSASDFTNFSDNACVSLLSASSASAMSSFSWKSSLECCCLLLLLPLIAQAK
jgi:cell division inhibitor SulA